ncbi:MAG: indolepyruvate ferredoxin oxidoreductase subunit alpha [archaeon]|nr:indolepyruvate ferredoxin oxidoreductase subunit alpha [archaeon]
MVKKDIRFYKGEGEEALMIGNEALVRGCLEAGVSFVSQYPGTPSSDIGETFQKLLANDSEMQKYLTHHWSINEAVASSEAAGAAWTGARALNPMKHVGLNVASDALSVIALNGPGPGALVLVVGSDPGSLGSHQEQNDRFFSWMLHLPVIEPWSPQENKDWIKIAFEMSEKHDIPIYFRTSTRVAHSRGVVKLGDIKKPEEKKYFERNIPKYCSLPPHAINNHVRLYERIEAIREEIPSLGFNRIISGSSKTGIITAGMPFGYTMEALHQLDLDDVPILKLGMIYPLNYQEIIDFCKNLDRVIIIEELEPFLEVKIAEIFQKNKIGVEIIGQYHNKKPAFPKSNEYSTGLVAETLAKIFNKEPSQIMIKSQEYYKTFMNIIPKRFPTFCAGCPERATLYAIKKATNDLENTVICGDIGCYVMSFFPPNEVTDFIICMSGGLSAAIGISEKTNQTVIAFIGDSTFLHTGMSPLAEAVNYNSNILLFIFENSWTAMTGHQPVLGVTNRKLSIENICKAIGVPWLKVIDSYDPKGLVKGIEKAKKEKGMKVIIIRRECALQANRWRQSEIRKLKEQGEKVQEVLYEITGCQMCMECAQTLACPAIRRVEIDGAEQMQIDEDRCIRCGVCFEICPNKAIKKIELYPFDKEVPFRAI